MSETCCTRLAENAGPKNHQKIRHLRTIAQLWRAVSSQLRHVLTIGKNLVNSSISSTCPHNMVNIGPLTAEIGLPVRGTSRHISMGFMSWLRYCTDVGHRRPIKLCTMFGRLLGWYTTVHFRGFLPRYRILSGARFTLHPPSLALSYFGSVTARHLSSGREPNCGIEHRAPPIFGRATIRLGIGPHCSFMLFLLSSFSFFPRLISAVGDWMFTILWHMVWP